MEPCYKCEYVGYCSQAKCHENMVTDRLIKAWIYNDDCFKERDGGVFMDAADVWDGGKR